MRFPRTTIDTGEVALPGHDGDRFVLLVVIAAPAERPAGADPLDIRDYANWLDPFVSFHRDRLQEKLQTAAPRSTDKQQPHCDGD